MSIILGLSLHHDGSACVVKDGKILSAISTERITKEKKCFYDFEKNETSHYVLDAAGISLKEVDYFAMNGYPHELFGNDFLRKGEEPCFKIPHHLSHISASYYTSNFDSSICLSADSSSGVQPEQNSAIAYAHKNEIIVDENFPFVGGTMYNKVTEKLGLGSGLFKAGSTMGLACYGNPDIEINFELDSYDIRDNAKIATDAAARAQYLLEDSVFELIQNIDSEKSESKNLCLGGGVFLNCTLNSKILRSNRFENIHHFPACGDDGGSVGAALYVAHHILDEPRYHYSQEELIYLGKDYGLHTEPDYSYIAKKILENKVVGWFMGRSEFGPRALGNRSIFANPCNLHMRDILNHIIKRREWFRPFAPIVLEEKYQDWFDFPVPSPHMLYTAPVKRPRIVPSITHVDGTARFQTVTKESNIHAYRLIEEFENLTNVPMLINTSLNGNNQPILETEEDAEEFFNNSNIDIMVINGKILEK